MSYEYPVSIDLNADGSPNLAGTDIVISDAAGDVVCLVPVGEGELPERLAMAEAIVVALNKAVA